MSNKIVIFSLRENVDIEKNADIERYVVLYMHSLRIGFAPYYCVTGKAMQYCRGKYTLSDMFTCVSVC